MRSRTSRGVPEWSGGRELYMEVKFRPPGKFRGLSALYRDHRKGPGGPPGGATYPGGPHGLKWEGNQPPSGLVRPLLGLPLRLGLETLGVGAPHLAWGASHPPWPPPPLEIQSLGGRRPPGPLYKEGGGRAAHPCSWRLPLPLQHLSLSLSLAKPCRDRGCFHHHAVVLLDLHQPLPPPC